MYESGPARGLFVCAPLSATRVTEVTEFWPMNQQNEPNTVQHASDRTHSRVLARDWRRSPW